MRNLLNICKELQQTYNIIRVPDKALPAYLYYIKIITGGKVYYKIGISEKLIQRLNHLWLKDKDLSIEIVDIVLFDSSLFAWEFERRIKFTYDYSRYKGEKILASGNSEIFTTNILKLDTDGLYSVANSDSYIIKSNTFR